MALTPGTRLGPYEVTGPLGAGGMGEVYRARDTRLDREVAVKVLPDSFAADPERLRRFEQEARAVGRLNHPNVLTLYDIGSHEGSPYLVCELLLGSTLRERLDQGPLPAATARDLALQVARGLAAAHDQGIIHRDLKPENLFVTRDGLLKVLDFGLAKITPESPGRAIESASVAATAATGTSAGAVLGTVGYMSPEQVRGRPADARSDVFAFGAILHEMLGGRRAFARETAAETLTAILREEPVELPAGVPGRLRLLARRCLTKSPEERPATGRDLVAALAEDAAGAGRATTGVSWRPAWVVGGLALAAVAAALLLWARRPAASALPAAVRLTQITVAEATETSPAFSPDGGSLLYTAESNGLRHLRIRTLADGADEPVTSPGFDTVHPAWSPGGDAVLFVRARTAGVRLEPSDIFGAYSGGDVFERDLVSGRERRLLENAFNPAVSPDGTRLAVDAAWVGPSRIWVTDRQGLNPAQLTTETSEAVAHLRPRWSPDGARLVFQHVERTRFDIGIVELATRATVAVTDDPYQDLHPVFTASGREILFSSYRSGGLNLWRLPVDGQGHAAGTAQQLTTGAGQDLESSVATDGRVAFTVLHQNASIWRLPVDPVTGRPAGEPEEVVATTREDSRGAWSPDGTRIAFNSDRGGSMNIWVFDLAARTARAVTHGQGGEYQPAWSPDGTRLVFFSAQSGNPDLWLVNAAGGEPSPLTRDAALEINPAFSPDGTAIAYQSDASGRLEVWVMGADGSSPRQLTRVGATGHFLRWSADGGEIVFRCPCGTEPRTLAVPRGGGEPRALAEIAGGAHMSFSPDGRRVMDVTGHKALWVSPLDGGAPEKVFEFADPSIRIDYPVWSPDGRYVLFDRFTPRGGDVWLMDGLEAKQHG